VELKRVILVICVLTLAAVVFSACGQQGTTTGEGQQVKSDGGSYRNITPAQLKSMLGNKDFLLVNVHVPYAGEISGTDDFVPYNEIGPNLSRFPGDKGAKI
jgi:phage shock protein E